MTHLPWMPLYIGDELARTSHFTAEEFGAYVSLIMHYWQHGGLPSDDVRLARIARASSDRWPLLSEMVAPLFEPGWQLPRLEEQRIEAEETHRKRSEAGRKGGRPRRDEKPGNNPGYKPGFNNEKAGQYAGPKQPQPQPQPHPYSNPESDPEAQSPYSALEKEREDADTRKGSFRKFPVPPSEAAGRKLLRDHGVPESEMIRLLVELMAGHLTPYDIEEWDTRGAVA